MGPASETLHTLRPEHLQQGVRSEAIPLDMSVRVPHRQVAVTREKFALIFRSALLDYLSSRVEHLGWDVD